MKRNRIVINLDQVLPRRRSGRGVGKPLLIIAIVLLLVIGGLGAGGYFWWRHYQSGPAYTLAILVDATQRNDTATVDGILDADKISDDFIIQVRQKLPISSADSLWQSQVDAVRSSIAAKLKDTLREQLIKELQQLTEVAKNKPFIIIALGVPRFVDIKQENNTATANANIKDEQIELKMQSDNNRWRIVAVKDDKLAKMVADSIAHSLPTNTSQLEDAIKKQLEKVNKGQ